MTDKLFAGGTVVTAEGSFRADVAVDGRDDRGGRRRPAARRRRGRRRLRRALMPGFIDGHTHLDMPFGGTVTADDWDTGTRRRARRRDDDDRRLLAPGHRRHAGRGGRDVAGQGGVKARIDYGLHVAITNLTEDVKRELPSLPALGVATVKIFMAYKGTPLYTADDDLFEAMQIARECGLLVLVHAENGDAIAKLQDAGARARRHRAALARAHAARGRRGRGDQPRDPARRGRRLPAARRPRLLRRGARGDQPRARPRPARSTPRPARSTSCSPTSDLARPDFEGAKYVLLAAAARPVQPAGAVARPAGRRPAHLRLGPLLVQLPRPEGAGPRRLHADPERRAGLEERAAVLWTHGVREGRISREPDRRRPLHEPGEGARDGRAQGRDRRRAPTPTSSSGTPT